MEGEGHGDGRQGRWKAPQWEVLLITNLGTLSSKRGRNKAMAPACCRASMSAGQRRGQMVLVPCKFFERISMLIPRHSSDSRLTLRIFCHLCHSCDECHPLLLVLLEGLENCPCRHFDYIYRVVKLYMYFVALQPPQHRTLVKQVHKF